MRKNPEKRHPVHHARLQEGILQGPTPIGLNLRKALREEDRKKVVRSWRHPVLLHSDKVCHDRDHCRVGKFRRTKA